MQENIPLLTVLLFALIIYSCSGPSDDKTASSSDNERADELYYMAISYSEDSLMQEKALELYDQAFVLYKKSGNRQRMASVYKRIGFAYDYLEDYNKQAEYLDKALAINRELGNNAEQAIIYNFLGICYTVAGDIDTALINYNYGLDITRLTGDTIQFIDLYQNMGITYMYEGDYSKAIECNIKALKFAEAGGRTHRIFDLNLNTAELFYETGDLVKAEEYIDKAAVYKEHIEDNASFHKLSGLIHLENSLTSEAEDSFTRVLEIGKAKGSMRVMASAYASLANIAEAGKDYPGAEYLALKSLELERNIGNINGIIGSLIELADIQSVRGNWKSALNNLAGAEQLCKENAMNNLLKEVYRQYYVSYRKLGNPSKALEYHEAYTALKDSLGSIEVREKIAGLELSHQNEKQRQQIVLLDRENKIKQQKIRTRNFFIFSLVSLSLAIVLLWLLYRQRSIRRLTEMEAELQKYILKTKEHSAIPDDPGIDTEAFSEKYDLTQRETEVIMLISQGMSNADIAEKIFVSSNTVKYHIKNIYLKLDVSNRVEALNKVVT